MFVPNTCVIPPILLILYMDLFPSGLVEAGSKVTDSLGKVQAVKC